MGCVKGTAQARAACPGTTFWVEITTKTSKQGGTSSRSRGAVKDLIQQFMEGMFLVSRPNRIARAKRIKDDTNWEAAMEVWKRETWYVPRYLGTQNAVALARSLLAPRP